MNEQRAQSNMNANSQHLTPYSNPTRSFPMYTGSLPNRNHGFPYSPSTDIHNSMSYPFSTNADLSPYRQPSNTFSNHSGYSLPHRQPRHSTQWNRNASDNILDIEKVKRGEDKRTTLMIRNIPNG